MISDPPDLIGWEDLVVFLLYGKYRTVGARRAPLQVR